MGGAAAPPFISDLLLRAPVSAARYMCSNLTAYTVHFFTILDPLLTKRGRRIKDFSMASTNVGKEGHLLITLDSVSLDSVYSQGFWL